MKLRIHDHSLRVRLTDADLRRCLDDGGIVQSLGETRPGTGLRCSLEIVGAVASPGVELNGHGIRVLLSRADAEALRECPEETLTHVIPADGEPDLTLCIEMDGPETCPAKATNQPCPLRR
jgi:hypothetical protein